MQSMRTITGPPRRRRWVIGLLLLGLFLAGYAVALSWFTQKVQRSVLQSLQELPVAADSGNPDH